jgi:hypothetical protein
MDELSSGTPAHTEAHRQYVETLRSFRNRPGGFWVASVDSGAAQEAIIGEHQLVDLETVVMLSDGASRLVDRFEQASWSDLIDLVRQGRPDAIIEQVRRLEADDPFGRRWPRGKSSDDATVAYMTDLSRQMRLRPTRARWNSIARDLRTGQRRRVGGREAHGARKVSRACLQAFVSMTRP